MLNSLKQGMGIQMQNNQQPQQGFNLGNFGNGGIQMTNGFGQGISHLKMYIFHLEKYRFPGFWKYVWKQRWSSNAESEPISRIPRIRKQFS